MGYMFPKSIGLLGNMKNTCWSGLRAAIRPALSQGGMLIMLIKLIMLIMLVKLVMLINIVIVIMLIMLTLLIIVIVKKNKKKTYTMLMSISINK